LAGDGRGDGVALERAAIVGDELDPLRPAGLSVDRELVEQRAAAGEGLGLRNSDLDGFDRVGTGAAR
jgi:hypothetical protein